MGKLLKTYIPQVLLIVFSVVLGVYLSNRIEKRAEIKKAEKLVDVIKGEIENNLIEAKDWFPYHRGVMHKLDSIRRIESFYGEFHENPMVLFKIASRNTLYNGKIGKIAWQTAKLNSAISEVPYIKLSSISNVYAQQSTVFNTFSQVIDLLDQPYFNDRKNSRENLRRLSSTLRELTSQEKELIDIYENALENLK